MSNKKFKKEYKRWLISVKPESATFVWLKHMPAIYLHTAWVVFCWVLYTSAINEHPRTDRRVGSWCRPKTAFRLSKFEAAGVLWNTLIIQKKFAAGLRPDLKKTESVGSMKASSA